MRKFAGRAEWMVAGVVVLLLLKYVVFGLDAWDGVLHPDRIEPADSPWRNPLLGVFS
jgi:hypothetical protein